MISPHESSRDTSGNQLACVAVRMIDEPPIISDEKMDTPASAVSVICRFLGSMDREFFCVVNLQHDYKPINMNVVSIGTIDCTLIHPREVFKSSILSNASSVILIHNHPSGCLSPSEADMEATKRLQDAGYIIGIPVTDHVIAGRNGRYLSFREQNLLPDTRDRYSLASSCRSV